MHRLAGAQAVAHCWQVPSLDRAHCLYVRSAGSNMQASDGVHGAPKWKHAPAPPDRHVKYAPAPAWNAQLGVGQPTTGSATGAPAAGLPVTRVPPVTEVAAAPPALAGAAGAEADCPACPGLAEGVEGRPAAPPHPGARPRPKARIDASAAVAITKRTARL